MRAAELRKYTESARQTTLQLVQHLDQHKMALRSPDGGWSVAMVLDHLRQVDEADTKLIAALVDAARCARNCRVSLVINTSPSVRQLMELCRLEHMVSPSKAGRFNSQKPIPI